MRFLITEQAVAALETLEAEYSVTCRAHAAAWAAFQRSRSVKRTEVLKAARDAQAECLARTVAMRNAVERLYRADRAAERAEAAAREPVQPSLFGA